MKVLLDTHAFIWWDSAPEKLSLQARAACQDRTNLLLLSVASAWERQQARRRIFAPCESVGRARHRAAGAMRSAPAAQPGPGADGFQRPLVPPSRFQPQRWAAKERGVGKPGSRSQRAHFSLPGRPSSKRRR